MKKMVAVALAGLLVLIGQGRLLASGESSEGYRGKFYGTVEQMPSNRIGTWIVDGRTVEVTPQTRIEEEYGRAGVGSYVEIKGYTDGKVFRAQEMEVKRAGSGKGDDSYRNGTSYEEFYGTITAKPPGGIGTWKIDGREVLVDERTRIEEEYGRAEVGARVEVKGSYQQQVFVVRKLEVKR